MANNLLILSNDNMTKTEKEKEQLIKKAAIQYGKYLTTLGFDWENDPNMKDTPTRVAKAFVNDFAKGCYTAPPEVRVFENVNKYEGIVFDGNIDIKSICSHHHAPFIGKAYVAYIPTSNGKVIGLSKLNRIVDWFARRPQIQENLTQQIADYVNEVCENNQGVAVVIEASHTCVSLRGVNQNSTMITSVLKGAFLDNISARNEFYHYIDRFKSNNK